MKEVLELFKNVKRGPKTSLFGALMMAFGGYLMYSQETTLEWVSVEVGIFIVGAYLCLTSDGLFFKKKGEDDAEV